MSNVLQRKREETELSFYIYGQQLQMEITKYIVNDKYIPKKWRYLIGQSLVDKVDELMDNIIFANTIYPAIEEELITRKKYQTMAIANCYQIQNKLLRLINCLDSVSINSLSPIIDLLGKEVSILKNWKKSSKIIK